MARISKAHQERRAEFLRAAQELFYKHGYAETPVTTIIDHIGVSKGTFYHYFDSKEDLLDQLVEDLSGNVIEAIAEKLAAKPLTAMEQLHLLFHQASQWKAEHKDLIMMMLHALYRDENLLLRHKMLRRSIAITTPILANIIKHGIEEGSMKTRYPDETAELVLQLGDVINEKVAAIFLSDTDDSSKYPQIEHWLTVYERKVEKMIGIADESLEIFDRAALKELLS